ncbi:MAG: hypothetical protein Q8932_08100, partial [Bacteroidota bacterium]|nr:hypothetical protein [Bacteroidota bacterium]
SRGSFRPLLWAFIIITLILAAAGYWRVDRTWEGAFPVLLAGNALLFLSTSLSFYLYSRALANRNTQFFLRMMYSSLLVKMVICLGGALLYGLLAGKELDTKVIFCCFGLYILYSVLEVKVLMRMSKLHKNA